MYAKLTTDANGKRITVFFDDGETLTASEEHPHYAQISEKVRADAPQADIVALDDIAGAVGSKVVRLSERITVSGGDLFFDGEPFDRAVSRHVLARYASGDESWRNLVAFMENTASNPSARSRRHLYHFLDGLDFQVTADGCFIAYKGVNGDGTSVHRGPGIVDGVAMHGHLPNEPGSVLEIARSYVDDDRGVACSRGLHVGTHAYASSFAPRLLTVKVNPRDVVSVPSDHANAKVRVCRYIVVEIAPPTPYTGTSIAFDDDGDEDYDEDYDEADDYPVHALVGV